MNTTALLAERDTQLSLAGSHSVVLTHGGTTDQLSISCRGAEQPLLIVTVGADGVAVRVSGATVSIEATDLLKLEARRLVLSALQELTMTCEGTISLRAAGELALTAKQQTLIATAGDVRVQANDDVRMNGERVYMNCD